MSAFSSAKKKRIILTVIAVTLIVTALVSCVIAPPFGGAASARANGGATADEASPDEATADEATPDEATPDEAPLRLDSKRMLQGFVMLDGRQYYFDSSGVMQKGGIVGSPSDGYSVADEDGVCCTSREICLAAEFLMTYCEGDTPAERMKSGFLYLARKFPYVRSYDHPASAEDFSALAVDMFTNKKGNCYRYAACFACAAVAAGYRARVVIGTTVGNPHGWTEVLMNGRWRICDPDAQLAEPLLEDYDAYMMTEHFWQITPQRRFELMIGPDGVAFFKERR